MRRPTGRWISEWNSFEAVTDLGQEPWKLMIQAVEPLGLQTSFQPYLSPPYRHASRLAIVMLRLRKTYSPRVRPLDSSCSSGFGSRYGTLTSRKVFWRETPSCRPALQRDQYSEMLMSRSKFTLVEFREFLINGFPTTSADGGLRHSFRDLATIRLKTLGIPARTCFYVADPFKFRTLCLPECFVTFQRACVWDLCHEENIQRRCHEEPSDWRYSSGAFRKWRRDVGNSASKKRDLGTQNATTQSELQISFVLCWWKLEAERTCRWTPLLPDSQFWIGSSRYSVMSCFFEVVVTTFSSRSTEIEQQPVWSTTQSICTVSKN